MNSLWIDTNVLLRFITGDPPEMAKKAFALFAKVEKNEATLRVSSLVIAESVWTLSSFYGYSKQEICDVLVSLLMAKGIYAEHEDRVLLALMQMAARNVDFTDAYLVATAQETGEPVCSFDQDFRRLGTPHIVPE